MKIVVLNGSPHPDGATSDMVKAFAKGAQEAGHEVVSINVAHRNIRGCMACEYCRKKEKGVCVRRKKTTNGSLLRPKPVSLPKRIRHDKMLP